LFKLQKQKYLLLKDAECLHLFLLDFALLKKKQVNQKAAEIRIFANPAAQKESRGLN